MQKSHVSWKIKCSYVSYHEAFFKIMGASQRAKEGRMSEMQYRCILKSCGRLTISPVYIQTPVMPEFDIRDQSKWKEPMIKPREVMSRSCGPFCCEEHRDTWVKRHIERADNGY